jgi:hypothetical protein
MEISIDRLLAFHVRVGIRYLADGGAFYVTPKKNIWNAIVGKARAAREAWWVPLNLTGFGPSGTHLRARKRT